MAKKQTVVTVLFYDGQLVNVCRSRAKANELAKRLVLELDYKIDKFYFDNQPLV